MKIDIYDASDRLQHLKKQSVDIGECCQDLVDKRPFGDIPFYIFAHARTDDDGVTKRLLWQPRLTKPKAQTNSMLFKAYPGTDIIKVIWMIPAREMWDQYEKGKLAENKTVVESIHDFQHNRSRLEAKEPDDLSDEKIDLIYKDMSIQAKFKKGGYLTV
jgi:hypothetical protein